MINVMAQFMGNCKSLARIRVQSIHIDRIFVRADLNQLSRYISIQICHINGKAKIFS